MVVFFFFKQKTAYEMRISDWSSDVCSSDLLGVTTAARLTANLAKTRFHKEVDPREVREALAEDIAKVLEPVAQPLALDAAQKPAVVLVVGVHGSGKTPTHGKLAPHRRQEERRVGKGCVSRCRYRRSPQI